MFQPVGAYCAFVAILSLPSCAYAQDGSDSYPSKPVRIIVGTAPGGTDVQARMYANRLSEVLGRQFLVENHPGKNVAWGMVSRAPADGHTLLVVLPDLTFAPALSKDLRVDPIKDFVPISLMSRASYLLVVNPVLPAKSVRELVGLARAQPGKLTFGGGLGGSGTHLMSMWFHHQAGIKAAYVPYRGTAQTVIDLLGGQIDAMFSAGVTTIPHIKTGKLRGLAISAAQRSKELPDMPTIIEQGIREFEAGTFHGWAAPAGTSPAIINKLSAELAKIAKLPEITEKLRADNAVAVGSTPDQFAQLIAGEIQRWRKLVAELRITVNE